MITLGIIVGSTRPGRVGTQVGRWARERALTVPGVHVELVDLAAVALPFLDEPREASSGIYTRPHTREWSSQVTQMDAIVLVTPEYNNSFPATLKNALDFLYSEWQRKPVAMIGYGMTSAGTRAVAALTPVVVALGMVPAGAVYLPLRRHIDDTGHLTTGANADEGLDELLADLLGWAALLRDSVEPSSVPS